MSHPLVMMKCMNDAFIDQAIDLLEKTNAHLDPESLSVSQAREQLQMYARARRLVDFGSPLWRAGSTRRRASRT